MPKGKGRDRRVDADALTQSSAWYSLSLMSAGKQLSVWQSWVRQPQKIWLRRALFQLHLWSGIALGLYILMMSVTGSVLVYRNELYRATTPDPIISTDSRPRLTDDQITDAARNLYPGYRVVNFGRPLNLDQAVTVWLRRGDEVKKRLFDARSGSDLGNSASTGFLMVSELLDLHDNLLAGATGRLVNGAGAFATLLLTMTGMSIWWPGIKTWRRSLTLRRGLGWKRLTWQLHSTVGFWSLAFVVIFGLSGVYLCIPDRFQDLADWLEPPTAANAGLRIGDQVIYWLAYLHFGRINGIGIPCKGPGLCDQTTKLAWAVCGLAPAVMFITGAIMWWNRVLRPRLASVRGSE
ncbi:MAG TPA: PepSY-associated TM helix domain-containing protein [Bryobacteraceae bacterium]